MCGLSTVCHILLALIVMNKLCSVIVLSLGYPWASSILFLLAVSTLYFCNSVFSLVHYIFDEVLFCDAVFEVM